MVADAPPVKPAAGRWRRLGKWAIALALLNEIRGLCVALPIVWAWLHH